MAEPRARKGRFNFTLCRAARGAVMSGPVMEPPRGELVGGHLGQELRRSASRWAPGEGGVGASIGLADEVMAVRRTGQYHGRADTMACNRGWYIPA
jgi:hypothetical protein